MADLAEFRKKRPNSVARLFVLADLLNNKAAMNFPVWLHLAGIVIPRDGSGIGYQVLGVAEMLTPDASEWDFNALAVDILEDSAYRERGDVAKLIGLDLGERSKQ